MRPQVPSPIQFLDQFEDGIKVFVKREDMIHPGYGGNKWRKLKYNAAHFLNGSYSQIVSYGGAFSNHIHALALLCKDYNIPVTAIVRGEVDDPDNPTLNDAREAGMRLIPVSRSAYRLKEKSEEIQKILDSFEKPFIVPEGGSNTMAKQGVMEIVAELEDHYDYIFLSAGTGMTASGIIEVSSPETKVCVVNALRNTELEITIRYSLDSEKPNWSVLNNYHFGGFAKVPEALVEWYKVFFDKYAVPLDPVYNLKTMYALLDCIKSGTLKSNSRVLYLHTGGLQGIRAFEYLNKMIWPL